MDMKAKRHAAKEAAQGRHPPAAGPDAKRARCAAFEILGCPTLLLCCPSVKLQNLQHKKTSAG